VDKWSFEERRASPKGCQSMNYDNLISSVELSLETEHQSLRIHSNPVLIGIKAHAIGRDGITWVLGQYCFFPLRIVEILGAMASCFHQWPEVHEELLENIGQECGACTRGRAHFLILRDCIKRELGLDFTELHPSAATTEFLDNIVNAVRRERASKEFVAGMAYAVEDSALPELKIVAELVNALWLISGHDERLLSRHASKDRRYAHTLMSEKAPADYTLEDFFAVHLLAIEVDHKAGLRMAIEQFVRSDRSAKRLHEGFEFALDEMDRWWTRLAEEGSSIGDDPGQADRSEDCERDKITIEEAGRDGNV
jgi:hypothetical protein